MFSPLAVLDLRGVLSDRSILIPVTGVVMIGTAIAMFRTSIAQMLASSNDEAHSLMNFSSQGTLRCVCGAQHPEGVAADRRQFCRSCGCEVVAENEAMLNKQLTPQEIKAMTRSLRRAAIRASHLELPSSITTVEELHMYLADSEPKTPRTPPTQPGQLGQQQVH